VANLDSSTAAGGDIAFVRSGTGKFRHVAGHAGGTVCPAAESILPSQTSLSGPAKGNRRRGVKMRSANLFITPHSTDNLMSDSLVQNLRSPTIQLSIEMSRRILNHCVRCRLRDYLSIVPPERTAFSICQAGTLRRPIYVFHDGEQRQA